MRLPLSIIAVLLAVLIPLGFLTEERDGGGTATTAFAIIAERVERLRGHRFDRLPRPVRVSGEQARREGLADLDRGYPADRRRADEALYTLLGLLPAGTDLRDVRGSIFGDQVAGYYDPATGRLRVVEGAGTANRVLDETVIAHELTHALDDQAFGLDLERAEGAGDPAIAYLALVEGIATELMYEYLDRHFDKDVALGGLVGGAFAQGGTDGLPPFVVAGLTFPYVTGHEFVAALVRRAGGRWTLADLALRSRPPESTEQVMHPRKWIEVEAPARVRLPGLARRLGAGHERLTAGVFGEWQTRELLARAGGDRSAAAAGWGGDRYELHRRDADARCATPCRSRDLLVMRWRWDTGRDAVEFEAALVDLLEDGLDGRRAGRGVWRLPEGAATVAVRPRETTLVLAPDFERARAAMP